MSLSPEKTKVTHISEGGDFLGQNVQVFLRKIRSIINENRTAKQQNLYQ